MVDEESENFSQLDLKEQLYIFFLELKRELTKKNIEIDKEQLEDIITSTKSTTILNYIRELVYMLINLKFPKEEEDTSKNKKINKDEELSQLESQIRKLEFDIRYFLEREFQHKIKRDTLEMKLNAYMEMESEFEELKDKVKYEGGKFLNNERKDNEIIILRQENSILKKEIEKYKENNKLYESKIKSEEEIIQDLKNQITNLNKKISTLEKENVNQPKTNNSSINININNNGNSSSKWIIKQENQEYSNYNNNLNGINNNISSGSNFALKKRRINNFTKNYRKNSNNNNSNLVGTKMGRYDGSRGYSGLQSKNIKSHTRSINTIDNNNAFTSTYSKILNSLCAKNKTPNKKDSKTINKKSNTICVEDYDKTMIENKYASNKNKKFKSNRKNISYNKIIGLIPNSRFPLSSKHQTKNSTPSLPKKFLQRDRSSVSHSALIINRK
jgi:hypothetical protein